MSKISALDKIASFLSRRDYSSYELEVRLKRAEYDSEEIRVAIEAAAERRWILPPEALAKKVAETLHRKGKSGTYISEYLQNLKLPNVSMDTEAEIQKALELIAKRLKYQPPFSFEQKQKILQFLTNRSYDEASIRKVMNHEIS